MQNLQTILNLTAGYFEKYGIDSPRLTAELLIGFVLGFTRMQLYINWERPVSEPELVKIRDLMKSRVSGIPVQYLTGEAYFYGKKFSVDSRCLIPRPETEELIEYALQYIPSEANLQGIDIGTGSGNIPIILSLERPNTQLTSIDSSNEAIEIAEKNTLTYGVAERIRFINTSVFSQSFGAELGLFDFLISNPPYIAVSVYETLEPEVKKYEPKQALTDDGDGFSFYRRIAEIAPRLLYPNGIIFLEIHSGTGKEILNIFSEPIYIDRVIKKDLSGHERIFSARINGAQA